MFLVDGTQGINIRTSERERTVREPYYFITEDQGTKREVKDKKDINYT